MNKEKSYYENLYDKQTTDMVFFAHKKPYFPLCCILDYVLDDSYRTVQIWDPAGKVQLSHERINVL